MQTPERFKNLHTLYGSAYTSGWKGLGCVYYDEDCTACWFEDCGWNSEDERIYNEFMRMNILDFYGELVDEQIAC